VGVDVETDGTGAEAGSGCLFGLLRFVESR
jgi:hypothetical protein